MQKYMEMIDNFIANIRRLLKLLLSCKRCANRGVSLRGEILCRLEYLNEEIRRIIGDLEMLDCGKYCEHLSSDFLKDEFSKYPVISEDEEYGYIFSLPKNKEVFLALSNTKYEQADDGGCIIIRSNPETLEHLFEKSEKRDVRRHIYLPNEDGSYFYSGEYVFDVQKSKDANAEIWISIIVMQANGWQRYDKMYIIDSLDEGDNTAFNLEQQIRQYSHLGRNFCERIKVTTLEQWDVTMNRIINDSSHTNVPILHLEVHGDENGNLIIGKSVIKMQDFMDTVAQISDKSNAKVLLTLAVCRGLAFFTKMKKAFASLPCSYVIGSSQPLLASNIEMRYSAFYRELLQDSTTKIDIRRAFRKMQNVFKDQPLKMEEYKGQEFVMMTEGQIFC